MKSLIKLSFVVFMILFVSQSCKKDDDINEEENALPTNFKVDIPSSLSRNELTNKKLNIEELNGNIIYYNLCTFINLAENSADLIEDIMIAIAKYNINKPVEFTYINTNDGRTKKANVVENSTFNNTTWDKQLTIIDVLSETNIDAGNAVQIFWNTNPVKGIAVIKLYNADRTLWSAYPETMYEVYYSEEGENNYEQQMIVSLTNLPLEDPIIQPYSISSMKMFAGKNGDYVDVLGNSNHPNAKFFTSETNFNWAFVASCNNSQNIAVAEVGLPSSTLNSANRTVILKDHSIKNVFTEQIYETWPDIDSSSVETYLHNTDAPGYFNNSGFIQGGTAPSNNYNSLETRMNLLSPYNPIEISNITILFK